MLTVQTRGSLYLAVTFQDLIPRHMQHPRGQGVANGSFSARRAQRHSPGGEFLVRTWTLLLKTETQAAVAPTLADLRLHLFVDEAVEHAHQETLSEEERDQIAAVDSLFPASKYCGCYRPSPRY